LFEHKRSFFDLCSQKKRRQRRVFNPLLQAVAQRLRDLELGHLHYFINTIFNTAAPVAVSGRALL